MSKFYTSEEYKENTINALEKFKAATENTVIYSDALPLYCTTKLIDCLISDVQNNDSFGYYNEQPLSFINLSIHTKQPSHENISKMNLHDYSSYFNFNLNINYPKTLNYINNNYKSIYDNDSSILDDLCIKVLDEDVEPIINYANTNNIEYLNTHLLPYKDYNAVYEYNNPDDREMFYKLLQNPVYTTPNNEITKIQDNTLTYILTV